MSIQFPSSIQGIDTQISGASKPERSALPTSVLKAAAGAQAVLASLQPLAPTQPSTSVSCKSAERLTLECPERKDCVAFNNALCTLQNHALTLFDLLSHQFPIQERVTWTALFAPQADSAGVEAFLNRNPDYRKYEFQKLTEIVCLKQKLDQFVDPLTESVPLAHDLWAAFADLQTCVKALVNDNSQSALQVLSEAQLSSVCLFALSIPPSAVCHSDVRAIIAKKLEEKKLSFQTDILWKLCQQLRPQMQKEALELNLKLIFDLLSKNDSEYQQFKKIHCFVEKIARVNPDILEEPLREFRRCGYESRILHLATALSALSKDLTEVVHYQRWCDLVQASLKSIFGFDCQNLDKTGREKCWTSLRKLP